jgi:hypothetical protein
MSSNYDKYKKMTPEQLQEAIDKGKVTLSYLNWLGVIGFGKQLRDAAHVQENRTA